MAARWLLRPELVAAVLAVLVAVPVWLPFLHPRLDLWILDDAENHLLRLYAIDHLLAQGVIYPRWVPDLFRGFGQPLLNFYAPLVYYAARAAHVILGIGLFSALQLVASASIALAAAGVAVLVRRLTGDTLASVYAAGVYVYAPYPFLTNVYFRGAVPEALAMALLPWLVLAAVSWVTNLRRSGSLKSGDFGRVGWFIVSAVLGAITTLAHNMMGPLSLLIAAGFAACAGISVGLPGATLRALESGDDRPARSGHAARSVSMVTVLGSPLMKSAVVVFAAVGLSAFFWLPVVGEARYVRLADVITDTHLNFVEALIEPVGSTAHSRKPDYPFTASGPIDLHPTFHYTSGWPLKLSWAHVLTLLPLAALPLARRRPDRRGQRDRRGQWGQPPLHRALAGVAIGAGCLLALSWWLTTTLSQRLWEGLPALQWFQFPFRFFGPISFSIALLAGVGAWGMGRRGAGLHLGQSGSEGGGWSHPGQWLRAGILGVLLGLLIFNALGERRIRLAERPVREVSSARLRDLDNRAGFMGTTGAEEYMPRTVEVERFGEIDRRVNLFETLYPEASWVGGLLLPYYGQLEVLQLSSGGLEVHALVRAGDAGGTLGIRQLDFPGWRTYVDGHAVSHGRMPFREDVRASLGFISLDVPPGEHDIVVSFESTPIRTLGQVIASVTGIALLVVGAMAARRAAPGSGWAQAAGILLLVATVGIVIFTGSSLLDQWRRVNAAGPPHVAQHSVLVNNLASSVLDGTAAVSSPSGTTLGKEQFVDVRWLHLGALEAGGAHGGRLRRWLYLHPPSRVAFELIVPPGADFQSGMALDPATWVTDEGDGVRFIVEVEDLGRRDGPVEVLNQHINPRARTEERGWNEASVSLAQFAGQRVRLTLRTEPDGNLAYDWAGWGNPLVIARHSARWKP